MKKILILFCLFFISVNVYSQVKSSENKPIEEKIEEKRYKIIDTTVNADFILPIRNKISTTSNSFAKSNTITLPSPADSIKGNIIEVTHKDTTSAGTYSTFVQTDGVSQDLYKTTAGNIAIDTITINGQKKRYTLQEIDGSLKWVSENMTAIVQTDEEITESGVIAVDSDGRLSTNQTRVIDEKDYAVFSYVGAGLDSTALKSVIRKRKEPVLNFSLSDTITSDKYVYLPVPSNGDKLTLNLSSSSDSYHLILSGDMKINGNYISGYKIEDTEEVVLKGKGGYWVLTSNLTYPDSYTPAQLYPVAKNRIGEYLIGGSEEYEGLSLPVETKYIGQENRLKESYLPPWQLLGGYIEIEDIENINGVLGRKGARKVDVLISRDDNLNSFRMELGVGKYPQDSGQVLNISFFARLEKIDSTCNLYAGGILNRFTTSGPVKIRSEEWKRYNVNIESTENFNAAYRAILSFGLEATPGTKIYFAGFQVSYGPELRPNVMVKDSIHLAGTDNLFLNFSPRNGGTVKTTSIVQDAGTPTGVRKSWQRVLDYCQDTEKCSGLFVDSRYEIDSSIVVHNGQTIQGSHSPIEGSFDGASDTRVANNSEIRFNPPDSLPNLILFQVDSLQRSGHPFQPRGHTFEGLLIIAEDTCESLIEIESSVGATIQDVEIHAGNNARYGLSSQRNRGWAKYDGNQGLMAYFERVYVEGTTNRGINLDRTSWATLIKCRLMRNDSIGLWHNGGGVEIYGTWFENNQVNDVRIQEGRTVIFQGNYTEPKPSQDSSVVINVCENLFVAGNYLKSSPAFVLDSVLSPNFFGNRYLGKLYTKTAKTGGIVDIGNQLGENNDPNEQSNDLIEDLILNGNTITNSEIGNNNLIIERQNFSSPRIKGFRQNLIIDSDIFINDLTNNVDFERLDTTVIGPFGDSLNSVTYRVLTDFVGSSADFGRNTNSPSLNIGQKYRLTFWAKTLVFTDTSFIDGVRIDVRQDGELETASTFTIGADWTKIEYVFTARSASSNIVLRPRNTTVPGDVFAIAKGNLSIAENEKVGYTKTADQIVDDNLIEVVLPKDSTLYFRNGNVSAPNIDNLEAHTPILSDTTSYTTNQTVRFKQLNLADVRDNTVTYTVPPGATSGTTFQVIDSWGNAGTNNITVDFTTNSYNVHGQGRNYVIDFNEGIIRCIYVNPDVGWLIETK